MTDDIQEKKYSNSLITQFLDHIKKNNGVNDRTQRDNDWKQVLPKKKLLSKFKFVLFKTVDIAYPEKCEILNLCHKKLLVDIYSPNNRVVKIKLSTIGEIWLSRYKKEQTKETRNSLTELIKEVTGIDLEE